MDVRLILSALTLTVISAGGASAQASSGETVTLDNFTRAESDMYMAANIKDAGGIGKLNHHREPIPVDRQPVIRPNRDTLYSSGVFDLDAGPVTITLPDADGRFMSLQPINEDHYVVGGVSYGAGSYTFDRRQAGTRYLMLAVRTLVDPAVMKDIADVHALQDQIKVAQQSPGTFEAPAWDEVSQKKIRDALLVLGASTSGFKKAFGTREAVDPIYHLVGTATGWGGNPERDAMYLGVTPAKNDGATVYRMRVKDVPVDGFWSISVYDAKGYFQKNEYGAYSLNNLTAKKEADGAVNIQFGGCDGKIANCLPIMPGWNYTVRQYRPRAQILDGSWTFPEARPVI